MEAFSHAEQDERRDRPGQLERRDAVDLPPAKGDPAERDEPEQQRCRRDQERVYAGSSDLCQGIR